MKIFWGDMGWALLHSFIEFFVAPVVVVLLIFTSPVWGPIYLIWKWRKKRAEKLKEEEKR